MQEYDDDSKPISVAEDGATLIARGNGRSYGDAALNHQLTLSMLKHRRLLAFDRDSGLLTCEAGVLLNNILEVFVPRGWFPSVVPGTKYVTVGGMIAADVHGKNHHGAGSFGRHVQSLTLLTPDGHTLLCSRTENSDLFMATLGGMGLTGVIVDATFRLIPIETAYLKQELSAARNLDDVLEQLDDASKSAYSVAWIDCLARDGHLGRSIIYRGEHVGINELKPSAQMSPLQLRPKTAVKVPKYCPSNLLGPKSMKAFNSIYYRHSARQSGTSLVDYDTFFFPLDRLLDWNRLYGRRGFIQYQCVLPEATGRSGIRSLLRRVAESGQGSFLSVLKLLGPEGEGLLSFPMKGITLALDFQLRQDTLSLLDELDVIVADHGGRIYLAKDARMAATYMPSGYARLSDFKRIREGFKGKFESLLSRRLDL